MSMKMEDEIKRWTAKRKSALVLDLIQGKTTVAEASRAYDLSPSEVAQRVDDGKWGMENALKAKPQDVREQYKRQLKDLQQAYGEAMLELRARKKLQSLLGEDEKRSRLSVRDCKPKAPSSRLLSCAAGSMCPGARCTTNR